MNTQTDLFSEPHIQIKDNQVLERACNRLLLMCQQHPELLNGNSVGEIDRRIYAEILWEDGIHHLIPSDKKTEFINVVQRTQESDVYSRGRRWLAEKDLIRLPAKAVQDAERMRSRISGALK